MLSARSLSLVEFLDNACSWKKVVNWKRALYDLSIGAVLGESASFHLQLLFSHPPRV